MTLGSKDSVNVTIDEVRTTGRYRKGAHSSIVKLASIRLAGLDTLRGLLLTIVLADHCGGKLVEGRFIRQWTLMGLGWSDAAEAFVFLSGFTFGWVYSARMERNGILKSLEQGGLRNLQLYLAFVCTAMTLAISYQIQQDDNWHSAVGNINARLMNALLLYDQPDATEILCLYVVCLPITLFTFVAFGRDKSWLLLLLSYACYSLVQIDPALNLRTKHGDWPLNPFAWQLLMVSGALIGRESRFGRTQLLPTKISRAFACMAACTVLAISLLFQKGELLIGTQTMEWFQDLVSYSQWQYEWLGKTDLGPLRLLHFAALVYLFSVIAPVDSTCWSHRSLAPLRACGRHSLGVYCIGVLLTHALGLVPTKFSSTPLRAVLLIALVLVMQFVVAALFDIRSKKAVIS